MLTKHPCKKEESIEFDIQFNPLDDSSFSDNT